MLQWARSHSRAQGRPICLRYNSEYAARIATGTWKAKKHNKSARGCVVVKDNTSKKHKAFAVEARRAWTQLKRDRGGQVWMQHVRREDLDYMRAGGLARAGKHGTHEYSETVN